MTNGDRWLKGLDSSNEQEERNHQVKWKLIGVGMIAYGIITGWFVLHSAGWL
jgi:hypothetical protein